MRVITSVPARLRVFCFALIVALGATACGSDTTVGTNAAGPASAAEGGDSSPEDVAAANLPNLQSADDARDVEVLSVADGSITTLRDSVDGDRPVLLWFFAPH